MSVHSKLKAAIKHADGHYHKYIENATTLMENPVGIGEHGDIIDEMNKHAKLAMEYRDLRDFYIKEFDFKDPSILKG